MVQARQQVRRKAHPEKLKDTTVKPSVQKLPRTPKVPKGKHFNGSRNEPSLSSQVHRLLDDDTSEDDFRSLLTGSKDQLEFVPPRAFDNLYAQDVFYRANHK